MVHLVHLRKTLSTFTVFHALNRIEAPCFTSMFIRFGRSDQESKTIAATISASVLMALGSPLGPRTLSPLRGHLSLRREVRLGAHLWRVLPEPMSCEALELVALMNQSRRNTILRRCFF